VPEAIDVMKALFGMEVSSEKFEQGLHKAEEQAEETTEKIAGHFSTMAIGIATALAVTVAAAMREVVLHTAQLTREMEDLSHEMGMGTKEASTYVGVMERVGIGHEQAARSVMMLAYQIKQASNALDPFHTKLGRTLGPMRDLQGNVLTVGQVLDVARQKVSATGDALQQLQIAQEIFGVRRGGKMLEVLRMSNEQFDKFKTSVQESGVAVDEAAGKLGKEYEAAAAGLSQSLRGLEMQLGEKVLPMLIEFTDKIAGIVQAVSKFAGTHPELTKLAAVFGLLVAPALALGAALLFAGSSLGTLTAFAARMGLHIESLDKVMRNLNFALGEMSAGEAVGTVATEAHTAAIQRQTAALGANVVAKGAATAAGAAETTGQAAGAAGGAAAAAGGTLGKALGAAALPIMLFSLVPAAYQIGQIFSDQITWAFIKVREFLPNWLGGVEKGTAAIFLGMQKAAEESKKLTGEEEKRQEAAQKTLQEEEQIVRMEEQRVTLTTAAEKLGLVTLQQRREALQEERQVLEERMAAMQGQLEGGGLTESQRLEKENEILKLRTRVTQESAKLVTDMYQQEELSLKAIGALGIENELKLLQEKLGDERIVGDERLKLEAQIFTKRRQYEDQLMTVAKQLGFARVDDEINFRKQRAAQEIGAGNLMQGAQELVKVRELQLKQFDEQVNFVKKMRFISLQDEIEYQKQKLAFVKGNAEEEMKILTGIADLDKQLYDQRLNYALNYTKSIQSNFDEMRKVSKGGGKQETWEEAQREAELQQRDVYRKAQEFGQYGGTGEQREFAVKISQAALGQYQQLKQMGDEIPATLTDFIDVAKGILKKATGGLDVRAYGEAQPVIGSLTSPAEGLATSNLARGTEIPRLDTSFVDIAVRLRDVLLGTVPNIQAFSSAIANGTRLITGQTGTGILTPPGNVPQREPALATGIGTPAQPPYGARSLGESVETLGGGALTKAVSDLKDAVDKLGTIPDAIGKTFADFGQKQSANAAAIKEAVQGGGTLKVEMDQNTGQLTANFVKSTIVAELKPY
jgi:hypothetical protein